MPGFSGAGSGASSSTTMRAHEAGAARSGKHRQEKSEGAGIHELSFVNGQQTVIERKGQERGGGGEGRPEAAGPTAVIELGRGEGLYILRIPCVKRPGRDAE